MNYGNFESSPVVRCERELLDRTERQHCRQQQKRWYEGVFTDTIDRLREKKAQASAFEPLVRFEFHDD